MNKLKKIADLFRRERAAQEEKKNIFCQRSLAEGFEIKTEKPILSVGQFLEEINPILAKEDIKPLLARDIKMMHLFTSDGRLKQSCFTARIADGIIYVGVNEKTISLTCERQRFLPIDYFRVYLDKNHFALCYIDGKGNVVAASMFYEHQDSRGDYQTSAVSDFPKNTPFREIK